MEEDYVMIPGSGTKKIIRDVKKEIETAFLDYSMSVIVSRALPDVRDGLKPVHRRILYTMHECGNDPSHAYRKSADTVGAVLGSYHPHGDASVYDAMVRLAQDFSLRYPLVDGQGNFGSVDGDPPAAYRYTEARMSRMAVEMLTDIDKDTIDWDPNFDETKKRQQLFHRFIHNPGGIGKVRTVHSHIGLHQQSVIHLQLRIETDNTGGGQESIFFRHSHCRSIMSDKSAQPRNNDTIILQ